MVRAILEGRKTQTRRAVKSIGNDGGFVLLNHGNGWWPYRSDDGESSFHTVKRGGKLYLDETSHACPYGMPGDRLWVREFFRFLDSFDGDSPATVGQRALAADYPKPWAPTQYEADGHRDNWMNVGATPGSVTAGKLRPGIHMPRWASRILLEVTNIRVERLQDISKTDAVAEGLYQDQAGRWTTWSATETHREHLNPIEAYRELWESINGYGSWEANPWVWVVDFKRVQQ